MKRTKASDGQESHLYDACGGRPQHQEEETWSDHSSVTLDQIEKELMALKRKQRRKRRQRRKKETGSKDTATTVENKVIV